MTAHSALALAAKEIGYYAPNDPKPGSKYGRWMAEKTGQAWLAGPSTSIWWCMIFATWAVYTSGGTLPGGMHYNTGVAVNSARKAGRLIPVRQAQPGDLVIFDWDGNGVTDHVGIVERNYGSYLQTIEGNTSGSNAGSQSSGNGVWRRTRNFSSVSHVIRPYYSGSAPAPSSNKTIVEDGYWGPATTRALQKINKTPVDGMVSNQPRANMALLGGVTGWEFVTSPHAGSPLIKAMQRAFKVEADGFFGPRSIRAMHVYYGAPVDDKISPGGSLVVRKMQQAINRQLAR